MKKKSPFNNLPGDDSTYVVWKYGAAAKMKNPSQMPNIQVVLREVDVDNNSFIFKKNDIIAYVPMTELDSIRIGSVWQKKQLIQEKWINYNNLKYVENIEFNFDFIATSPQIVKYNEHIDSLNDSISNIYKLNIYKSNHNELIYLNKTIYTKLVDKNITVLIPSMELFISTYTPANKEIKKSLLNFSLDTVLSKYIIDNDTKVTDGNYFIGLKNKMEDSTIKFLAFAKHNKISRNRISHLSSSLELNSVDIDSKYKFIYPKVLPYHPSYLYTKCDGVFLNEKTFLVHRIYQINLPSDSEVHAIINKKVYNINKKYYKPEDKKKEKKGASDEDNEPESESEDINSSGDINSPIDSNELPNSRISVPRIKTQVIVIDDKKPTIIVQTEEKKVDQKIEDKNAEEKLPTGVIPIDDEKTVDDSLLTDAEEDSSGNNLSQQMDYSSGYRDKETDYLFKLVINVLNDLKLQNIIHDYNVFDDTFNKSESKNYFQTTFYQALLNCGEKKEDLKNSWYKLKQREDGELKFLGFRVYLLIEIKLSEDSYLYLLEIGKKSSETGYLGVVFKKNISSTRMKKSELIEFLKNIVDNKGNYSKQVSKENKTMKPVELDVIYETYKHKFKEKEKIFNRLKKIIKSKIEVLIGKN